MTHTKQPASKPGKQWGDAEKTAWLRQQKKQRSYQEQVVNPVLALNDCFRVEQYGLLDYDVQKYPLYAIRSPEQHKTKQNILITGGVHGYETSGILGALAFIARQAEYYTQHFNWVVIPCVSPWGFETINRWNPNAIDPNRSFTANSMADESRLLMDYIKALNCPFDMHIDLHETTDTDNTVFRPALAARDAIEQNTWDIPDGFYLVGDTEQPAHDFQAAIIKAVQQVTHIAPCDDTGKIIGETAAQEGVINYPVRQLGLCTGITLSKYRTTTEVYPDSDRVTDEDCINAQVAAIVGGLEFLRANTNNE